MTLDFDSTYSSATRFSVVFCVVAALLLPAGFFVISYESLQAIMDTEAEINSNFVSRVISTNPELWRYETIRIEEILARRPRSGASETRRIFDDRNVLVAESVNALQSPQITTTYDVKDGDVVVGRIEIIRSLLPILLKSGILALFGLGFGLLLYQLLPFQAVIKTGKRLQDTNDFLLKVMEASTNSLVVLDLDGTIRMCNGRFEVLSECSREALLERHFSSLFTGDARLQVHAEVQAVLQKGAEKIAFETVLARQDGVDRSLVCGVVPLLRQGTVSGVVVSLDDITDRIKAEEARMVLERHFQQTQRLESLGVLAGGIAHDFNNILSIILGYCYVIKDDSDDSVSAYPEYIQKIEDAANRAADLCRQMLSYAGKNELQHAPVNMQALVADIEKMLHSGIKKNVAIKFDLHDDLVITVDSSQIQQVVMNLIINAAEAIGDHNGTVGISLKGVDIPEGESATDYDGTLIPAARYVCLEVSDNGCGMDSETQRRIFEPFYTTKFAGRGLGMSATLGIIRSHEGALQLSSAPGAGTTFRIFLPLQEPAGTVEKKPAISQPPGIGLNGTVLLVDDEEELRALGPAWLEKIGFAAITAANGREALGIFREQSDKINLIILDLLMPEMDGNETYRRIRAVSRTIPIIFCSGCSRKELSADILEDVHAGFLKKPYDHDQLRGALLDRLEPLNTASEVLHAS